MRKGCNSRRDNNPAIWSISALVSRTPEMGESRAAFRGCRAGVASICVRKSGEALNKNQARLSWHIATCVWVRPFPLKVPARNEWQLRQLQFHCGKPPPAAEPRISMRILAENYSAAEA